MFNNPIKCQSRRNLALVLKSQVKEKKGKEKIYYGHSHNLHSFITFSNLSPVRFFLFFFLPKKCKDKRHTFACLLVKSGVKKTGRTPKLVILRVRHDIKRMREVLFITHLTSTWQTLPCTSWQKFVNYPCKKHLKTSKDAEFEGSLFQNDEDTAWQSREIFLQILALLGREGACKMGRGGGGVNLQTSVIFGDFIKGYLRSFWLYCFWQVYSFLPTHFLPVSMAIT